MNEPVIDRPAALRESLQPADGHKHARSAVVIWSRRRLHPSPTARRNDTRTRRVSGRAVLSPGAGLAGEARASSGAVFHDAVVGAAGSRAAGAGTVARSIWGEV